MSWLVPIVIGVVLIVLGILVHVENKDAIDFIGQQIDHLLITITFTLIGIILMIIAFIGWIGAMINNHNLIGIYNRYFGITIGFVFGFVTGFLIFSPSFSSKLKDE